MPRIVELPTSMTMSQKFSCADGHLYFVRTRWTITSDMVVLEEAIVRAVEKLIRSQKGGERFAVLAES